MKLIRTQASADFSTAMLLLYGQAGSGKTTTAFGAPSPLVLDVEDGCKAFTGDIATVRSIESLNEIITYLRTDQTHPYETVVLDGLDALYAQIYAAATAGKPMGRDQRLSHVEPSRQLSTALRALAALPLIKVITAHAKVDVVTETLEYNKKVERTVINLNMPPSMRMMVEGLIDVGAYCYRKGHAYQFIADTLEHPRGSSWGKDRSGKLGGKAHPLKWQTFAEALNI